MGGELAVAHAQLIEEEVYDQSDDELYAQSEFIRSHPGFPPDYVIEDMMDRDDNSTMVSADDRVNQLTETPPKVIVVGGAVADISSVLGGP